MSHCIGIDARKAQDFGIGTYIRHLVDGLGKLDTANQYLLFVGPQAREAFADVPPNFRLVAEAAPVYSARELIALSWKLWRLRVDLYHATHYVLPTWVPGKAIVTIHDLIHLLYPEFLPSPLAYFYAQRMIRHSLDRGDAVLAISERTKRDLMEFFDVRGDKIEVVPLGVSGRFAVPVPEPQRRALLERLGIRRPYVLFVGNPKPHKNLDTVLRAWARACHTGTVDAELVCVGDRGPGDFKLRQIAEQAGIADRLRLVGHVADEELPAIYQGASVFLFPTLHEGFGLPVVEAMAAGVPVVTSNRSALREVAEGAAQLVDPLDVEAIAAAVLRCLREEEHRERLIRLGRQRAETYTWQRTAARTLAIYREQLGERREPFAEAEPAP